MGLQSSASTENKTEMGFFFTHCLTSLSLGFSCLFLTEIGLSFKLFHLNYLFKNRYLNDGQKKVLFLQLKRTKMLKLQHYYKSMKNQVPTAFIFAFFYKDSQIFFMVIVM